MSPIPDLDPAGMERQKRLGGAEFTGRMVGLFTEYVGEKLAVARAAQDAGDLAAVAEAVHPVKSSAGNVGATRLQALASEAEQRAREQNAEAVGHLMDELEQAFQVVKPLLQAELDKVDPGQGAQS